MEKLLSFLYNLLLKIPAAIISLTALSYGRALSAYLLGDKSQKYQGKLTLMPSAHLDPLGFLSILMFGIGWSKQGGVNTDSFKYKYSMIIYYISGPVTNFIVALLSAFLWKFVILNYSTFSEIKQILITILNFNLSIASISLLPIPPFTGFYIILELLPYDIRRELYKIEKYGMIIFILLIVSGVLTWLISPIYSILFKAIAFIVGL